MLEELKEEEIVNKVGGRFKLSTLIQKRLVQLNRGSRPLVDFNSENKMEVVLQEILQDKIFLSAAGELAVVGEHVDLREERAAQLLHAKVRGDLLLPCSLHGTVGLPRGALDLGEVERSGHGHVGVHHGRGRGVATDQGVQARGRRCLLRSQVQRRSAVCAEVQLRLHHL